MKKKKCKQSKHKWAMTVDTDDEPLTFNFDVRVRMIGIEMVVLH